MNSYKKPSLQRLLVLILALLTIGSVSVQAQSNLFLSKNADFSTSDREFGENDVIYMKVESGDVDFSSVRTSKFFLSSRSESAEFVGAFENNFDGTYSAELPVAELDLSDYLWEWQGFIEDASGQTFETRVLLRLGSPDAFTGFEVRAVVQEKGEASFTLKGHEFLVTDQTQFFAELHFEFNPDDPNVAPPPFDGPVPSSFDELQVDYSVRVKVVRGGNDELIAQRVEILGPAEDHSHVTLSGRVQEIDANASTLIVRDRVVQISEDTQVGNTQERVGDEGIPPWLVDRLVRIYGEFDEDESILAHYIEVAHGVRPELEVRGQVEVASDEFVVVQGFEFAVGPNTVVEGLQPPPGEGGPGNDGNDDGAVGAAPLSLNEINPGLIVRVHSVITAEGVQFAERIEIESGNDPGVRISGAVEEIIEGGFSIRGWMIQIEEHVQLFNENFEPIPFEELKEGQIVMVFGEFQADGTIRGHHVEFRRAERDEFSLFGPVTSIGDNTVTIWDVVYTVTENTRFEKGPEEPFTLEDLKVGQLVDASGVPDGLGGLDADRFFIPDGRDEGIRVSGEAMNVTDLGFEVLGMQIVMTEETQLRDRNYEPVDPSEFGEGVAVQVYGVFAADGSIKAHEVMLTGANREELELWGLVQDVQGDIVTVGNIDFIFSESSKIFDEKTGTEVGPGDLGTGMQVSVQALVDVSGTLVIEWLYIPQQASDDVRITGEVTNANVNGMELWGQQVVFDEATQFVNSDYQPVGPEAIENGMIVDVFGVYEEDNVIRAYHVELRGEDAEELSLSGRVEFFDGVEVVVGGTAFRLTDFTQIFSNSGEDFGSGGEDKPGKYGGSRSRLDAPGKFAGKSLQFTDLAEGVSVEIVGTLEEDGTYAAAIIHVHDEVGHINISGNIESIETGGLLLQGRRIEVTLDTYIQNENFEQLTFDELVEGQGVEVYGELRQDGSVMAYNITLRADVMENLEFAGRIESLQGEIITVRGTAFITSDVTLFESEEGPITLADLELDQEIYIAGQRDENGVLIATRVQVTKEWISGWMTGAITDISDLSIVVQGRTVLVTENTQMYGPDYQPLTLEELEIDQRVFVSGELVEDGGFMAYNVEVKGAHFDELEVRGPISAIEGDLLEVNGRLYIYTESTVIWGPEGLEIPFSDLMEGQGVGLVARPNEGGSLVLAKVYIDGQSGEPQVRLRGAVQEVLTDGFMMQGRMILVSEETMIVGDGYEPIPLEALELGQIINVFGGLDEAGNVLAHQVEAHHEENEEIEFRGVIEARDGEAIVIRGFTFFLDEESFIDDGNGFPVDPDGLEQGMLVNVVAKAGEEGTFVVRWMQVGAGNNDSHVYLSASIETIDLAARMIRVMDREIRLEEFTEIVGSDFEFIPLSKLVVGTGVRVFGQYKEGGQINPYRIEVRGGTSAEEIEFRGRIEELAEGRMVVRGFPFVLTPNTEVFDEQGQFIPFEELTAGQIVMIVGTPSGTEDYTALRVFVTTGNEDRSIRVAGRLVEVDGDNRVLIIRDHTIWLNEFAEIVGETYERISFNALEVGRQVSVWGWLHEDGRIEGHRVELRVPEREEFRVLGRLTDLDGDKLFVRGIPFKVLAEAYIGAPDIGRLSLADLFPGLIVEVEGMNGPDGELVAGKVLIYGPDERDGIELSGVISNLVDGAFDIGGIEMSLGEKTFVLDGNDQRIQAEAIQDGFSATAIAFGSRAEGLDVRFVQVYDIIQDERSLIGRIVELGESSFQILEHTFEVNENTVFLDPLGDEMAFADLTIRMRVDVQAIANGTGTLVARMVQAKPRDRKLTGTVTAIEGDYMKIAGLTVAFDVNTAFYNSEDEPTTQSAIVPGLTVNLTMTLGPGGSPVATEVRLLARIEDEVVLNGTVEAVLEDQIVVLGRRFQVIQNTLMLGTDDLPTDLGSYSVGDAVRIRALLLAGDNLVALRIRKLEGETDIRVEGPIVSVNSSTLEVMGVFFFLNEESAFYDLDRNEVDATSLAEGQTVSVIGQGQANGTVVATRVNVQNVSLTSGEVTGLEGDEFSMFGNSYRVDDNTMVLGENNVQLSLDDIEGGQYLEVRGVGEAEGSAAGKQSGSSILVSKIKIVDAEGSGEYELEVEPGPTAVEDEELPETFELFQNYPNPFNPVTTIRFTLPVSADVILTVYDVTGREVQRLVSNTMTAGTYEVQWNGRNQADTPVASGVYLYRLQTGNKVMSRRMVLLK